MASNEVLSSRLDALSDKVDELRDDIKEDIGTLTTAIGNLSFVDQRVHDIEIGAVKEMLSMYNATATSRIEGLESEIETEKERRATNFRLAIGAIATGVIFPVLVGLIVYELIKG